MTAKKRYSVKRSVPVRPSSFDEGTMTIDCVYATETLVDRGEYDEILVISENAIVDDRLSKDAVPLIWNHDWDAPKVVGRVMEYGIEGKSAVAKMKLSSSDYSKGTIQDIKEGVIKNVSVGYDVLDYEEYRDKNVSTKVIRRVTRWEPFEISLVGIPADPNAGFRSKRMDEELEIKVDENEVIVEDDRIELAEKLEEAKEKIQEAQASLLEVLDAAEADTAIEEARQKMWRVDSISYRLLDSASTVEEIEETVSYVKDELQKLAEALDYDPEVEEEVVVEVSEDVRKERARVASITSLCRVFKVSSSEMSRMIENGTSAAKAKNMIKNSRSKRSAAPLLGARTRIVRDEGETKRKQIADAIYSRLTNKPVSEAGKEYRGMSIKDIAADLVGRQGRTMRADQLYKRSFGPHTSSDLGLAGGFGDAVDRVLRDSYELRPFQWDSVVVRTTVRNFVPVAQISASAFPAFKMIPEGAEIEFGTASGVSGQIQIAKWGRAIGFTEEAFINDDLRLISKIITNTGVSARNFEDELVYSALTSDALRADGRPLFFLETATGLEDGNIIAEALDLKGLAAAQAKLLTATDDFGNLVSTQGTTLIVGPELQMAAYQLATPITPSETDQVNPFSHLLSNVIVDARIKGDDWYLSAGAAGDRIELAGLDGHAGVQSDEFYDYKTSSTAYRAKVYGGASAEGRVGWIKSLGADETDNNTGE